MPDAQLTIRDASVFDDPDRRRIDFDAEADGELAAFSLQYDALEALAGEVPDEHAVALFQRHRDRIAAMAARALARGTEADRVIVSENDLDQPG